MTQYAHEINWRVSNPNAFRRAMATDSAALGTVAQQKNSYVAGLYWHTDLESAKKASVAAENRFFRCAC